MNETPNMHWTSGAAWTVGILTHSPQQLATDSGVLFHAGRDDFDDYLFAVVADSQIDELLLFQHIGSPDEGTEVQVDTSVGRDDALNAIARQLGMDIRSFSWITPYRSFPESVIGAGWRLEDKVLVPPKASDDVRTRTDVLLVEALRLAKTMPRGLKVVTTAKNIKALVTATKEIQVTATRGGKSESLRPRMMTIVSGSNVRSAAVSEASSLIEAADDDSIVLLSFGSPAGRRSRRSRPIRQAKQVRTTAIRRNAVLAGMIPASRSDLRVYVNREEISRVDRRSTGVTYIW